MQTCRNVDFAWFCIAFDERRCIGIEARIIEKEPGFRLESDERTADRDGESGDPGTG